MPDLLLTGGRVLRDRGWHRLDVRVVDGTIVEVGAPAAVVGDESRGQLEPGARADVTILDGDLHVVATLVAGEAVHAGEGVLS